MTDDRQAVEAAGLVASVASVAAVASVGGLASRHSRDWYRGLDKPALTLPESAHGPVWALLYAGQAVAAWLVWRGDARRAELDVPALGSYAAQLGLNGAWTLLFFGLRRPGLALVDACVLWVAVAVTVRDFARRHKVAAGLLLPYLGWLTYAVVLNAAVWWRNR